ncbi:MAG TPA: vanadium-dependent haloperoxidase [Myxococcus sp.]|jgi:hypothetical protein|nr:vanadium-dependent haloperoxidase [Myxococcus sp.]
MSHKDVLAPQSSEERRRRARRIREKALEISQDHSQEEHRPNGEESDYRKRLGTPVANYSKGLPHNERGEVRKEAYDQLQQALRSGDEDDFERIPLGVPNGRKQTNPQSGLSFDLEGPDAQAITLQPVPRLDSRQNTAEMIELYWMSLLRDVPFIQFGTDAGVAAAAAELDTFRDVLRVPAGGRITPGTVFRGSTVGSVQGPLISQYLLRDIPYGSLTISQRQQTVPVGLAGTTPRGQDYLTDFSSWLAVQNGVNVPGPMLDPMPRYIRSMRDIARYVQVDALYEAYLNAALILLGDVERGVLVDPGNHYRRSRNQQGFVTFGGPHILSLLTEVATRALKAMWFQKWYVHRRLRPEEFGGRVDIHRRGVRTDYPIRAALLSSQAHQRVLARFNTSLLPQAFPEGSPTHPSYGSGHATVAGACVTILKAWFDGQQTYVGPAEGARVQQANADGTELVPYTGGDAGALTIGGELDKLAANISGARNMAGVHWRSDYSESIRLGQKVALRLLQEQSITYNEPNSFDLVDFDGRKVQIEDGRIEVRGPRRAAAHADAVPVA